jgi:SAM-dependent methyltransferase
MSFVRSILAHPLTRGVDLDDPRTTELRREIIRSKPFLRRIYQEWYGLLAADLPVGQGRVLELGSGAGFFRDFLADVICSEVFVTPGIDVVLDGQRLPLADGSLRAIVMTDVFHHLPRARVFLAEAARCVRVGGVIAMIEPWSTRWSRFVYQRLHHELFRPEASEWEFPSAGPLSGANGALPWIVFERDRTVFEREFPQWTIERIAPLMPLRYLVSGGVSMRSLAPGFAFGAVKTIESLLPGMAMFAQIVLRRIDQTRGPSSSGPM